MHDSLSQNPDYIESLAAFVHSRPPQCVPDFIQQSNAVLAHDVEPHLGRILAPTLYERVEDFNQRTLAFLRRHEGLAVG
jgi:hypothetical protein